MHDTLCSSPYIDTEVVKKRKCRRKKKDLWCSKKKLEQSRMSNAKRRYGNMRGTTKDLEPIFKKIDVPLPVVSRSDRSVQIENDITSDVQENVEIEDLFVEASFDGNIVPKTQVSIVKGATDSPEKRNTRTSHADDIQLSDSNNKVSI